MRKFLLIIAVTFFASFVLSSCGDETYGKLNDSKKKVVVIAYDNNNQIGLKNI